MAKKNKQINKQQQQQQQQLKPNLFFQMTSHR